MAPFLASPPASPRYVSGSFSGPFLAGYAATPDAPSLSYGLVRLDHAVGNTTDLLRTVEYIMGFTGGWAWAGGGTGGWWNGWVGGLVGLGRALRGTDKAAVAAPHGLLTAPDTRLWSLSVV